MLMTFILPDTDLEVKWSHSVVSSSLRPHGQYPTRLRHPWDFPGKNTGVGCRFLLQGIFPTQGSNPGLLHCRQMLYHLSHQGSLLGKQILKFHFRLTESETLWGRRVNNKGFNKLEGGSESQQSLKTTMIELLSSWLKAWTPESDRSSNSVSATK